MICKLCSIEFIPPDKRRTHCEICTMARRSPNNIIHTRFYVVWRAMKSRCYRVKNWDYKHYGARGITVCEEWHDSKTFINWCEKQNPPEGWRLERRDNALPYSPSNCEFVPEIVQHFNQRSNIHVEYGGKNYVFIDLVRLLGIVHPEHLAYSRLYRGWEPLVAATTPPHKTGGRPKGCKDKGTRKRKK